MAHAADMTGPRYGLAEIGDPGRPDVQDGGSQGEAYTGGTASRRARTARQALAQVGARAAEDPRPAAVGTAESDPLPSPPLSPEEIADIKAIASGAVEIRHVTKSELYRIVSDDTGSRAHV